MPFALPISSSIPKQRTWYKNIYSLDTCLKMPKIVQEGMNQQGEDFTQKSL